VSGFLLLVFVASVIAGATASVAGFGIGSLLTPLLASRLGTPLAIAVVAIPHAVATILRAWRLRRDVDWPIFWRFGLWSAAGGLSGAILFTRLGGAALTRLLGGLLILTALSTLTGWSDRFTLPRWATWTLGLLSGFFGGIVGNQGGLRAGALLGLGLTSTAFVATTTLTGVIVDVVRTPLYVAREGGAIVSAWPFVATATVGVIAGTLMGERAILGLSPERFRRVVAVLVGLLGIWLLFEKQA